MDAIAAAREGISDYLDHELAALKGFALSPAQLADLKQTLVQEIVSGAPIEGLRLRLLLALQDGRPPPGWHRFARDLHIYLAVRIGVNQFGLAAYRNEVSAQVSACDVVADALLQRGNSISSYERVRKIYAKYRRTLRQTPGLSGGLQSVPAGDLHSFLVLAQAIFTLSVGQEFGSVSDP